VVVEPAQVMVVTPHPDDAEYGVAGTVARWAREGKSIEKGLRFAIREGGKTVGALRLRRVGTGLLRPNGASF